jgi:hypothetical protein
VGGTKQVHTANNEPTYTDKSKCDAETGYGVKQKRGCHGNKCGAEQSNERCAGKCSQRDVDRVQSAQQQRCLFFDTVTCAVKKSDNSLASDFAKKSCMRSCARIIRLTEPWPTRSTRSSATRARQRRLTERTHLVRESMDPWLPLCNLFPDCFKTLPALFRCRPS